MSNEPPTTTQEFTAKTNGFKEVVLDDKVQALQNKIVILEKKLQQLELNFYLTQFYLVECNQGLFEGLEDLVDKLKRKRAVTGKDMINAKKKKIEIKANTVISKIFEEDDYLKSLPPPDSDDDLFPKEK